MATSSVEMKLDRALREIAALRRDLQAISQLINADVRTADRLVKVSEACEILGVKKSKVYELIRKGLIPARKEGKGRYRISFNQLQKYIRG